MNATTYAWTIARTKPWLNKNMNKTAPFRRRTRAPALISRFSSSLDQILFESIPPFMMMTFMASNKRAPAARILMATIATILIATIATRKEGDDGKLENLPPPTLLSPILFPYLRLSTALQPNCSRKFQHQRQRACLQKAMSRFVQREEPGSDDEHDDNDDEAGRPGPCVSNKGTPFGAGARRAASLQQKRGSLCSRPARLLASAQAARSLRTR